MTLSAAHRNCPASLAGEVDTRPHCRREMATGGGFMAHGTTCGVVRPMRLCTPQDHPNT